MEKINKIKDNNSFRFLEWNVYKDAQDAFVLVLKINKKLSSELKYTAGSQIIRSSLSVVLNIAEGSGRFTDKEMKRFFDISNGSINETVAALDSLLRLKAINEDDFDCLFGKYKEISRQIKAFKRKL